MESNRRIEQFLSRGNAQIQEDMHQTWFPIIELGRRSGSVRPDLTGGRMIESGCLWDSEGHLVAQSRQIGLLLNNGS